MIVILVMVLMMITNDYGQSLLWFQKKQNIENPTALEIINNKCIVAVQK